MVVSSRTWLRMLLVVAWLAPFSQAGAEPSVAIASAIDTIARQAVANGQTAGLVVAVAEQGKPVFNRSYGVGNLEWQAPATADTVFRIGSITKQFAAACVLLLTEQKKLSLDDRLAKYFPDFPRASEVSIRQLLNHTSGLHSYPGRTEETIARAGITVPDMVKHLGGLGYDFNPGSDWAYSNTGYFLIGAIIEKVSGQTFRDFARERLFEPLGLTNTAVDLNEEVVRNRAAGYERDPKKPGAFVNALYSHMSVPHAAGAIRSTAADLIKWTAALHGGRVLSAASYKEMTMPTHVPGKDPINYGLGLSLASEEGHSVISHNGGIDGFESSLNYVLDQKVMLVILANTQGGVGDLRGKMLKALLVRPPSSSSTGQR